MAERAYERHAWIVLFAVGIIFALFGAGDMVSGVFADPAIAEGITGMTPEELQAADPATFGLLNVQVRTAGAGLMVMGLLAAAIAAKAFRAEERWAWYALWTLPLLNVLIFVFMYVSVDFETGVLPPPLLSAPIFLAITVVDLLLPIRRFFPKGGLNLLHPLVTKHSGMDVAGVTLSRP